MVFLMFIWFCGFCIVYLVLWGFGYEWRRRLRTWYLQYPPANCGVSHESCVQITTVLKLVSVDVTFCTWFLWTGPTGAAVECSMVFVNSYVSKLCLRHIPLAKRLLEHPSLLHWCSGRLPPCCTHLYWYLACFMQLGWVHLLLVVIFAPWRTQNPSLIPNLVHPSILHTGAGLVLEPSV